MIVAIVFLTLFAIFLFVACVGLAGRIAMLQESVNNLEDITREEGEAIIKIDEALRILWEKIDEPHGESGNVVDMYPKTPQK